MADRQLRYVLTGVDKSAGSTLDGTAKKAHSAGQSITSAFSKVGQVLGGEVGDVFSKLSEGMQEVSEHSNKLSVVGAAAMGVGAALTSMGDKEQAATQQLDAAIKNTGHSADEFEKQIEETVGHMEKFGYTAINTKQSLQTLVNATHDPTKALNLMGEAADLAASKHITLESAATQLAKVVGGHGARTLAAYNIQLVKNKDGTTDWTATNQKLAQVLSGQASAASDTFTGKLKQLRAVVEDNVAVFGQKYGPAIIAAGTVMTVAGPLLGRGAGAIKKVGGAFRTTATEAEGSATTIAAADTEIVAANQRAAASSEELAAASKTSRLGMVGVAGGIAAVGVGVAMGGNALSHYVERNNMLASVVDTLPDALGKLSTALVNSGGHTEEVSHQWVGATLAATGLADRLAHYGVTVDQASKAMEGGAKTFLPFLANLKHVHHASADTIIGLAVMAKGFHDATESTDESTKSTNESAKAMHTHVSALQGDANALHTNTTSLKAAEDAQTKNRIAAKQATLQMQVEGDAAGLLSAAFDKLNGKTMDAEEANIAFKDALHALNDTEKTNGHTLSDNTDKGRRNVQGVLDAIKAAQGHAQAVGKQSGSVAKATRTFDEDRAALQRHLIALGYNRQAVDRLIERYGKMPKVVLTRAELKAGQARAEARRLGYEINRIHQNRAIWMSVDTSAAEYKIAMLQGRIDSVNGNLSGMSAGTMSSISHNAGGTRFFAGGRTSVAEREPEVIAPRGTMIMPLSRMGGGGNHATYNIHLHLPKVSTASPVETGRAVAAMLEPYIAAGGKIRGI